MANRMHRMHMLLRVAACLVPALVLPGFPAAGMAQSAKGMEPFAKGPYTGPIEKALVGIEVINMDEAGKPLETRHGNGFFLRSDGYILIPSALISLNLTGTRSAAAKQHLGVFLEPGTRQEHSVSALRPRFLAYEHPDFGLSVPLGYTVFKLPNIQAPALRTLLPDTLKPDDEVEAAWSGWDAQGKHFTPVQRRKVKLAAFPKTRDIHRPGYLAFTEGLKEVPSGAAVIGPDEMGVGMIPGASTEAVHEGFIAFHVLQEVTNCITPFACTDAEYARIEKKAREEEEAEAAPADGPEAKEGAEPDKMVSIPGGPAAIPSSVLQLQLDMEGAPVACVAPFKIDRYKVSNHDYLAFWVSLPEEMRRKPEIFQALYPAGWGTPDSPFPSQIAKFPVIGVPLEGARAYARWKGKRLPTPYEWCLAAFGPKGVSAPPFWFAQYMADTQKAWTQVRQAHEARLLELIRSGISIKEILLRLVDFRAIPWVPTSPDGEQLAQWSKQVVLDASEPLQTAWKEPNYLQPGGSRPFDRSPYGVMDMMLNGAEQIAPNPALPDVRHEESMLLHWVWSLPPAGAGGLSMRRTLVDSIYAGARYQDELIRSPILLSRLYTLNSVSPRGMDHLLTAIHLTETAYMLRPLDNWALEMIPSVLAETGMGGVNPELRFTEVAGLPETPLDAVIKRLWMPTKLRVELGHPLPLHTDLPDSATDSRKTSFLFPTGFRCAR